MTPRVVLFPQSSTPTATDAGQSGECSMQSGEKDRNRMSCGQIGTPVPSWKGVRAFPRRETVRYFRRARANLCRKQPDFRRAHRLGQNRVATFITIRFTAHGKSESRPAAISKPRTWRCVISLHPNLVAEHCGRSIFEWLARCEPSSVGSRAPWVARLGGARFRQARRATSRRLLRSASCGQDFNASACGQGAQSSRRPRQRPRFQDG